MFNNDQSVSYLAESAAQVQTQSTEPIHQEQPVVNQSVSNQWQSYSDRMDVAPYMSRYNRPPALRNKNIDVLGSVDGGSSFKTGLLLSSLMILGSVAGYSLEKMISKEVRPKGYGAIVGTLGSIGIYYTTSKILSTSFMEGFKGAAGFVVPMFPLFIGMYQKEPMTRNTALIAGSVAATALGFVVVTKIMK